MGRGEAPQGRRRRTLSRAPRRPDLFGPLWSPRAAREIDLGVPQWSEDPTPILNILRTYLTHGQEEDPARHFHQGAERANETVAKLIERVPPGQRQAAGGLAALSCCGASVPWPGCREYPKFYAVRVLAAMRRVLAGAGAELVAAGRLDRAENVFFLDLGDLQTPHDLRALAAANRENYERERSRRAVPRVLTSTGEAFYSAPATTPGALIGTAASPGVFEGRVRVIFDPREAELEPGEVLVAPGTDPAWTPLFLSVALVMEIGGIMSHGSVVAARVRHPGRGRRRRRHAATAERPTRARGRRKRSGRTALTREQCLSEATGARESCVGFFSGWATARLPGPAKSSSATRRPIQCSCCGRIVRAIRWRATTSSK